MQRKTLAMPTSSFLPNLGGMEVGLHNIAKRVADHGWDPVVIAPYSHVKALRELKWDLPYKVISFPPKIFSLLNFSPALGFKALDLYFSWLQQKHHFSFWHVTMGYPTGCAVVHFAEAQEKGGKRINYLVRCAGEDIQKQADIGYGMRLDPRLDQIISSILPRARILAAITQSVRDEYRALGVPDDRIADIPNGVDVQRFQQNTMRHELRKSLGIESDELLILSVGRHHPKKNFKMLLVAGEYLLAQGVDNFKIVIAGRNVSRLVEEAAGKKIAAHLIFKEELGKQNSAKEDTLNLPSEELVGLYKAADIFAFPSLIETFGIVLVEAMAAELPVLAMDVPGCRDILEDGKWGLLANPEDPESFQTKLKVLVNDKALRKSLTEKSGERVIDFSWNGIVEKYVKIYDAETSKGQT